MVNVLTQQLAGPKQTLVETQQKLNSAIESVQKEAEIRALKVADEAKYRAYGVVESPLKLTRRWAALTKLQGPAERIQKTLNEVREKRLAIRKPAIENYDSLNVKQVVAEIDALSLFDLQKTVAYELANKNRKTVLEALERKLA